MPTRPFKETLTDWVGDDANKLIRDLKDDGYVIMEIDTVKQIMTLLKKIEATKWD